MRRDDTLMQSQNQMAKQTFTLGALTRKLELALIHPQNALSHLSYLTELQLDG
jgi:hypothetical protein